MTQNISKALVVDDSRLARIALSKLLKKRAVDVDVVGTGTEAIDYLRNGRPDVVFMDYMMPDMDGFEATRRIRDLRNDNLPVVMYTSQDTDEDREKARQLGIAGFLSKPSGEHNLDEVLRRLNQAGIEPHTQTIESTPDIEPPRSDTTVDPGSIPESEAAEPVVALVGDAESSWTEMRAIALDAAAEVVGERLDRLAREELQPLRERIDLSSESARSAASELAQSTAETASREAAEAIADRTARLIAEEVAQETASRVAQDVAPDVSSRVLSDLRRDIRHHVSELFAAEAFKDQITAIVIAEGIPALERRLSEQTIPALRDQISGDALKSAERAAVDAARRQGMEAAQQAAEHVIDERLRAERSEADRRAREQMEDAVGGLRRLLWTVVVLASAGLAGSVLLTLWLTGAFGG